MCIHPAGHLFREQLRDPSPLGAPRHLRSRCRLKSSLQDPRRAPLIVDIGDLQLTLAGELDIDTRDHLREAGRVLLRRHQPATGADFVIDAGGLRFVDAGGIAGLLALRADLAASGCIVRIVNASPQLSRLSFLCGLDQTLGLLPVRPGAAPLPSGVGDEPSAA